MFAEYKIVRDPRRIFLLLGLMVTCIEPVEKSI
jgi:hypothetical protein